MQATFPSWQIWFLISFAFQRINFDNNNISFISIQAFIDHTNLTNLQLNYNKITAYPNLDSCKQILRSLGLTSNALHYIVPGYFVSFHRLEVLNLGSNGILKLTINEMRGLFNLQKLGVEKNRIRSIGCDTFDETPELEVLNLAKNDLSDLPCIRSTPETWSLRQLNLRGNRLTGGFNASVASLLKNVHTLDVSKNDLGDLTNFITEMPSIKFLWLDGNKRIRFKSSDFANAGDLVWVKFDESDLTTPPLFRNAKPSLDYLDFGKNSIDCVDIDHISNMQNMTLLNFTENKLQLFPDIGCYTNTSVSSIQEIHFPKMEEIILTRNQIYEFPLLPGMPFKSVIRLQHNELVEFPPERLALLTKVDILQMQYNNASEFPDFSQLSSSNMTDLDLSHNNISSVPTNHIATLVSLEYLRLQHNFITDLPHMGFAHKALNYLYIHHNLINQLDPMILSSHQLWNLTHLYASNNFLTEVPQQLLAEFHRIIYLDISYNILEIMPCVSGVGPSLEVLLLHHNNLTHIPAECVRRLGGLKKLDLAYNFIVDFPFWRMAAGHFPSLSNFNISNNLLRNIPDLQSNLIPKSLDVDVRSNNLICTFELCWLKTFDRFTLKRDKKLCSSPSDFVDLAFKNIGDMALGCYRKYPTRLNQNIRCQPQLQEYDNPIWAKILYWSKAYMALLWKLQQNYPLKPSKAIWSSRCRSPLTLFWLLHI